jgi:prevent-host-death family protein
MYCKMQYIRKVAIRELQQNIRRVMELVERGETVEVTRRRRSIARLTPVRQPQKPAPWPDLDKRARSALGTRVVDPGAGEQVLRDRGNW